MIINKVRRSARGWLVAAVVASSAVAQTNLLFFGNSFIAYDDVPKIVAQLITAAGYPAANVKAQIINGSILDNHLAKCYAEGTNNVIYTGLASTALWDIVVIQGRLYEMTNDPLNYRQDAVTLDKLVRARGSNAVTVLFEVWKRQFDQVPVQDAICTTVWLAVRDIQTNIGTAAAARFGGVGEAFRAAGWPADLYNADLFHPGQRGSLLAGMVLFRSSYQASVKAIAETNVTALLTTLRLTPSDWRELCNYAEPMVPEPGLLLGALPLLGWYLAQRGGRNWKAGRVGQR